MDIVDILIEDTAKIMNLDTADRRKLQVAASEVRRKGILTSIEHAVFVNYNFPIICIFANILKESPKSVMDLIKLGMITYADFCCAISIYAQDRKFIDTQK